MAPTANATIIGAGISVRGELNAGEDVVVRGRVAGRMESSADVIVDEGGTVEAVIKALNIEIHGTVNGDVIVTDCLTIHSTGRLTGNSLAPRVIVMDGGYVKGHINTDDQRQEVIDAILSNLSARGGSALEVSGTPKWGGSSAGLLEHAGAASHRPVAARASTSGRPSKTANAVGKRNG